MKKLPIWILVPLGLLAMLLWLFAPRGSTFLMLIFLAGAGVFYWGFRTFREFRILEDTPLSRVRSMPMGLVHVKGKATSSIRLTSPLTKQPCFYYRLDWEKWKSSGDSEGWVKQISRTERERFYLDDSGAKAWVNPEGAEFDVLRTFHAEIGPHSKHARFVDPSLGTPGPSEQELREFIAANPELAHARTAIHIVMGAAAQGAGQTPPDAQKAMPAEGSFRFSEYCLLADHECSILGTCAENPNAQDEHDRNLIQKGQNEKTFLITTRTEREEEKRLRHRARLFVLLGAAIMIFAATMAIYGDKPKPAPASGQVDMVTITQVAPRSDYKGPCPGKFALQFAIRTTGPAQVEYVVFNQAGAVWDVGSLHFDKEGLKTVSWPLKVGMRGRLWRGWAKVKVVSPNSMESKEARLSVDCRP